MTAHPGRKWERRIERAQELAAKHPFAAQALRFYERLAGFQRSLYAGYAATTGTASLRDELEPSAVLPSFAPFLALIEEIAPPPLAESAAGLSAGGGARWEGDGAKRSLLCSLCAHEWGSPSPGSPFRSRRSWPAV